MAAIPGGAAPFRRSNSEVQMRISGSVDPVRAALAAGVLFVLAACAHPLAVTPPATAVLGAEETGIASWYGHPHHGQRTASGEVYDMYDLTAAHTTLPLGTRLLVTNLDNARAVDVRVNDRGPFVDGRILDLSYAAARVLGADRAGIVPVRLRVVGLPGTGLAASPTSRSAPRDLESPATGAAPSPPPGAAPPASPGGAAPAPSGTGPSGSPGAPSGATASGRPASPAPPAGAIQRPVAAIFTVQVGAFTSRPRAEAVSAALGRDGEPATVSETQLGGGTFYRVRVGSYADREAARAAAERLAARGYRPLVVGR
jgi:rare lipoprotein A